MKLLGVKEKEKLFGFFFLNICSKLSSLCYAGANID